MKKLSILALATASLALTAFRPFDPGKAGWKTITAKVGDADVEVIELRDGNPIWIDVNGAESTLGGETIRNLNTEAKNHRTRAETAEASLKKFEGITDPAAAIKAIETVSKIDQKTLMDAGEVDRVKAAIEDNYKGQITEKDNTIAGLTKKLDDNVLNGAFSGSKYVQDKIAVPVDMLQHTFGDKFKVEDGKIVAYDATGARMLSKAKQGEYADFDEALEIIVGGYSQKDAILKGGNHGGSGNQGGGGGGKPGTARYSRSEYNKLPPIEQQRIGLEAGQGKAEIYDE